MDNVPQDTKIQNCQQHNSAAQFYCQDQNCEQEEKIACNKCTLEGETGIHSNHDVIDIQEFESKQQEIFQKVEKYLNDRQENQLKQQNTKVNQYILARKEINNIFLSQKMQFLEHLEEQQEKLQQKFDEYYIKYAGNPLDDKEQYDQLIKQGKKLEEMVEIQYINGYQPRKRGEDEDEEFTANTKLENTLTKEFLDQDYQKVKDNFRTHILQNKNIQKQLFDQHKEEEKRNKTFMPPPKKFQIVESRKKHMLNHFNQNIQSEFDEFRHQTFDILNSFKLEDKSELERNTVIIESKMKFDLHPSYSNYPQTQILQIAGNKCLYSNLLLNSRPNFYQLTQLDLNSGKQINLAGFDREIFTILNLSNDCVLIGLSRFDSLYCFNPSEFQEEDQPPKLSPIKLNLFEKRITPAMNEFELNTQYLQKINEKQFLVTQSAQFSTGYSRQRQVQVVEQLTLCQIYEDAETKQIKIWQQVEFQNFEGRVSKVIMLDETKFAAFYNRRSTDYYSNQYQNFVKVFSINSYEPLFTFELSSLQEIGQITCLEQMNEKLILLGTYFDFFLIDINVEDKKVHILDRQKSKQSIYYPLQITQNIMCFFDGHKTQFWKCQNEKLVEEKYFVEPIMLHCKNEEGQIVTVNTPSDDFQQNRMFLNVWKQGQF